VSLVISGITWILSYRCNLNCAHCFFDVQGDLRILDHELAREALVSLEQTVPLAWQHVSGGEPLLFEAELHRLLEVIQEHGSKTVGIATNGFWGDSEQRAQETVSQLKRRGVNGLCLSADDYHQSGLSIDHVRTAAEQVAAQGLNKHSFVVCCQQEGSSPSFTGKDFALPLAPVLVRKIGRGAAVDVFDDTAQAGNIPAAPCRNLCCCLGETTPFDPQMVWIDPYGNVMICYGLIIGNLYERSLGEILRDYSVNQSPLLKVLAEQGPVGLYRLAVSKGWQPEGGFADECSLCWQARYFLRKPLSERLGPEVLGSERLGLEILGPDECYPEEGSRQKNGVSLGGERTPL
jgi:hypothetical protein